MALETIVGDLRAYKQFVPGTFQHADQLMDERKRWFYTAQFYAAISAIFSIEQIGTEFGTDLRKRWFYTADGQGYFPREEGGVDWAITREPHNLVLRHLDDTFDDAFTQLIQTDHYYCPPPEEAQAARIAPSTVVIDMSRLRLSGDFEEWLYLAIRTKDGFVQTEGGYQEPNDEEQKVMKRLGYTRKNLAMLRRADEKIQETGINVLNPAYVREKAQKKKASSLWQASMLCGFNGSSGFHYHSGCVVDYCYALRGVRASGASAKDLEAKVDRAAESR